MAVDPRIRIRPSRSRKGLHGFVAVVTLLVAAGLLLYHRYAEPPEDFSTPAPARGALSEARLKVSESYSHEKEHLEQLHRAQKEMDEALLLLDKAERDDPARKQEIETLRSQVQAISDERYAQTLTPAELHRAYQELLAKLEAIIKRR